MSQSNTLACQMRGGMQKHDQAVMKFVRNSANHTFTLDLNSSLNRSVDLSLDPLADLIGRNTIHITV